jgi:2-dehydro-3-deoxygluconokinase
VGVAGAESNVAIGVSRLGGTAAWAGRVGDDEFGQLVLQRIRGEGVDVSGAVVDPDAPTSLMVAERLTGDVSRVVYYRRAGPGSRLRPEDLDEDAIRSAGVLHLTGITPALGASARATVLEAARVARSAGTLVSFDVNHRSALWGAAEARPVLLELVAAADVVFAGLEEAEVLGCAGPPEEAVRALAALGPAQAVVTLGADGALACVDGQVQAAAAVPVHAVDAIGAGDAFVAGYLAETLAGLATAERLATAVRCGAFAVTTSGDWEGLPSRRELDLLGAAGGTVVR